MIKFGSVFLGLCLACYALLVSAEVYEWKDDKGRVHYSDQAPEVGDSSKIDVTLPAQGVRLVDPKKTDEWAGRALSGALPSSAPSVSVDSKRRSTERLDSSEKDLCDGVVGDCFNEQQDYVCKLRFGMDCKAIYHWKVCLYQDCQDKRIADKCESPWHLLDRRPSPLVQSQMGRSVPLMQLVSERDWNCLRMHGFYCDEVASEQQCQQRYGASCDSLKTWPKQAKEKCIKNRGADCDQVDSWLVFRPISGEEKLKIGNRLAGGGYHNRDVLLEYAGQGGAEELWRVLEALPGLNIGKRQQRFDCNGEWRVYSP